MGEESTTESPPARGRGSGRQVVHRYDEEAKRLTNELEEAFKDGNKDAWKHLHGDYDEAKRMKTMLYVSLQGIYDARARL